MFQDYEQKLKEDLGLSPSSTLLEITNKFFYSKINKQFRLGVIVAAAAASLTRIKHLPLCFRYKKTFVAVASLSLQKTFAE